MIQSMTDLYRVFACLSVSLTLLLARLSKPKFAQTFVSQSAPVLIPPLDNVGYSC